MNSRRIKVLLIAINPGDTRLTRAHSEPGLGVTFYFTVGPSGDKTRQIHGTRPPRPEFESRRVLTGKAPDIDPPSCLEKFLPNVVKSPLLSGG